MADTSLASSRPLVECPCCRGRKALLISVPCTHCEETGTVQAEVPEPDGGRVITKGYAEVFRSAVAEGRVRYEPLDLAMPAAAPKPKRRVRYDPRGLVNKPKPRKSLGARRSRRKH